MRALLFLLIASSLLAAAMTPEARKSFEAFEKRAEAGVPDAMYRLSALLETGFDTIPADTVRSIALLRRAAHSGYAPAQNYLGYLFSEGKILSANPDSASFWIRQAADAGDPKAAHNLAYMILSDNGRIPALKDTVPNNDAIFEPRIDSGGLPSDSAALAYLILAADAGLPQSQTLLADLLVDGNLLEPDTLQATELYQTAIASGFRDAELKLLNVSGPYLISLPATEALSAAIQYWKIGAYIIAAEILTHIGPEEDVTPQAYALLGHAYSRGLGLPYDHHRANEYFARAAIMGNPSAQFILSETLEIFPDALEALFPDLPFTAADLRNAANAAGITTPAKAIAALLKAP